MPSTSDVADAGGRRRPAGRLTERHDTVLTVVAVVLVAAGPRCLGPRSLAVDVVATAFLVPLVLVDLRERRLPDPLTLGGSRRSSSPCSERRAR